MKAWGWVAILSILGSLAHAQSLGDAAKRERERRDKKKQEATETTVIRDEDLHAAPGKDAKGTFNPAAGSVSGAAGAASQGGRSGSPSPGGAAAVAPLSEVDAKREAARRRLEASYQDIAGTAWSLVRAVREFQAGCQVPSPRCQSLGARIESFAISVGTGMDKAEDAAREGWLPPGDVRAMRERYNMADSFWDELVRAVRQYRR